MTDNRIFNRETNICFIGIEKVFDNVNRNTVRNIMEKRGYSRHLINTTHCIYVNTKIILELIEKTSKIHKNKQRSETGLLYFSKSFPSIRK